MLGNSSEEGLSSMELISDNNIISWLLYFQIFSDSGGDVDVVVASDKEVKLSPVREAFQAVFGKATVS
jgi:hypothetical protein